MKALVTGGAGFIGSNLVEELLQRNFAVVVYDDFSTGNIANLAAAKKNKGLKILKADVMDSGKLKAASRNCDVIFHMAAQVGNVLSLEKPFDNLSVNAAGTLNAFNAARENRVKSLIYSSSCAIFGETKYTPIDESHPIEPVSPYGATKLAGEQLSLVLGSYYDVNVCALRYFNVYGKNQRFNPYGNVLPIFAERIRSNQQLTIYGDGNQTRDFIDVRDVVAANILAFERQAAGAVNIGTGAASTVNQLVKHLETAVGRKLSITHQPPRKGEVRHSVANISKAKGQLGFTPRITLKQGVKDYMAWFGFHNE